MRVKCPYLTFVGIISIIGGFCLTVYGLSFVEHGNTPIKIDNLQTESTELSQLTSINIVDPDFARPNDPFKSLKANFDTLTIFQGEEVGITMTATGIKPDVQAIFVLIADPVFDIKNMTTSELIHNIDLGRKYRTTIELIPDNGSASKRQMIPFLTPHQNVMIYGVTLYRDGHHERFYSEQIITTVLSKVDKLQAETNEAILQQINETRISNAQQERTNKTFIGLSWIGVALAPLLAGVDILLRVRFEGKDDRLVFP